MKTVVTLDAGEPNDLHPHDKKLVASRLFDAACALLYGGDNVQPMVERIEERDGMLCVSYATVARQGANPVPCTPLTLDGGDPGEFEFVCAMPCARCLHLRRLRGQKCAFRCLSGVPTSAVCMAEQPVTRSACGWPWHSDASICL